MLESHGMARSLPTFVDVVVYEGCRGRLLGGACRKDQKCGLLHQAAIRCEVVARQKGALHRVVSHDINIENIPAVGHPGTFRNAEDARTPRGEGLREGRFRISAHPVPAPSTSVRAARIVQESAAGAIRTHHATATILKAVDSRSILAMEQSVKRSAYI